MQKKNVYFNLKNLGKWVLTIRQFPGHWTSSHVKHFNEDNSETK